MPCPEVIQPGFTVSFFASELVMIRVVVDELKFAAPGIIIGVGFDGSCGVGDDRSGLQMIGKIIEN